MDPSHLAELIHRSLHLLDGMERETTGDRIAAVADLVAHAAAVAGWSAYSDGGGAGQMPRLVLRHLLRPVRVAGDHYDVRLGQIVEGHGLHASRTAGPQALRRRAETAHLQEILVVGGYAPDATRWVTEFYADDTSPGLAQLLPVAYPVMQAALSFPRAARQRAARRQ